MQKAEARGVQGDGDITQDEGIWARLVCGKLQWSPHWHRPLLSIGQALAKEQCVMSC